MHMKKSQETLSALGKCVKKTKQIKKKKKKKKKKDFLLSGDTEIFHHINFIPWPSYRSFYGRPCAM